MADDEKAPFDPSEPWLKDVLEQIGRESPPPASVATDKTESKELFGDEQRRERLKAEIHTAFIWLLRTAMGVFILVFIVRALHFVLPDNNLANSKREWMPHGWLDDTQLQTIDKFFFSGTLGALITKYLGPIMGKKEERPTAE